MIEIGGKADPLDIEFLKKRFGELDLVLPCPTGGNAGINPHVTRVLTKDGRKVSLFHVKPIYYRHINGQWRPMSEVTVHHGNRRIYLNERWTDIEPAFLNWLIKRQALLGRGELLIPSPIKLHDSPVAITEKNLLFTVTTKYPDPNPESTTVDGYVAKDDASWATARDSAVGDYAGDADANTICAYFQISPYYCWRNIFLFDTSSITDTDVVSDAYLSFNAGAPGDAQSTYLCITQSNPTSNTSLGTGDFDQTRDSLNGGTEGITRFALSSWSAGSYNDLTLNATGRGWVSLTGISKFGVTLALDMDNTTPTGTNGWGSWVHADNTGTSSDPKLTVTHAEPSYAKPLDVIRAKFIRVF